MSTQWLDAPCGDEGMPGGPISVDQEIGRAGALILRVHDRDGARREALARLNSASAKTRALAVEVLGNLGDPSTIPALTKIEAGETNKGVKRALKKVLRLLQSE